MNAELPVEVDVQSLKQLLDSGEKLLLVDVREPDEYALARIDGSTLIPMRQIPDSLAQLDEHREGRILVHCHHGGRSLRVTQWLRQKGYSNAQNVAGGIDAWSQQIDPGVPRY